MLGTACAFQVACAASKQLWTPLSGMTFDAPHRPCHSGEVRAVRRQMIELSQCVFSLFFLSPLVEQYVGHCKKTKNKKVWLFICWFILGTHYFDCNVFGLESFIELSFFFHSHPLIFDFYIIFSPHSFNYNVFGLESFIDFFFNFFSWHLIFISNLILILLIVIFSFSYPFLNWNCFSISSLMIFFMLDLVLILFKSIFFLGKKLGREVFYVSFIPFFQFHP